MDTAGKSERAFRTIGELSAELGMPQHILRYWETRFPQLRPLTRAGNRRYYRPQDVALVKRIATALNRDGYTIRGVQRLLADKRADLEITSGPDTKIYDPTDTAAFLDDLRRIRRELAAALAD